MNRLPGVGAATRTTTSSIFRRWRNVIQSVALVLVLAHAAFGFSKTLQRAAAPCSVADPSAHDASDVQGVTHYMAVMRQLFAENKFAELDCIADAARASKARFASGGWKVYVLYISIVVPQGHATEKDWTAHLKALNRWISVRPESITARVTLADAYISYAWDARGEGFADTVTGNGWKLFDQRIQKAKDILEEASRLKTKCPHWYNVMQSVALAQGWDRARATALLDQAVAFEPGYQYYYRSHAHYLKPQWHGEDGDSEKFTEEAADRVGGAQGDILYYQMAANLVGCHCTDESQLKRLSWPRIQKGVAELEKQNGVSMICLNILGYMATRLEDPVVAHNMFWRMGDNWDRGLWRTKEFYDANVQWANEAARLQEGPEKAILRRAHEQFQGVIRRCVQESGDMVKFDLVINLTKFGIVESTSSVPQTRAGLCLVTLKGEKLSPFPPFDPYAFTMEIDPALVINTPTNTPYWVGVH